jgi:large subunit ribosomal protein L6
MSRIGKLVIDIPDNIELSFEKNLIIFSSGDLKKYYKLNREVRAEICNKKLKLNPSNDLPIQYSMYSGMDRSNIKNILIGLHKGFRGVVEINGVGYKAVIEKEYLVLTLGYSHEVFYVPPTGVNVSFEKPNLISVSGSDKTLVGQTLAEIISFRKTEPYKGKGIKLFGKKIIRKEGKKK